MPGKGAELDEYDQISEVCERVSAHPPVGVFTGTVYESVQQQRNPAVGYRPGGGCLLYVHQSERILGAEAHT